MWGDSSNEGKSLSLILNLLSFLNTFVGFTINGTQHYGLNRLKITDAIIRVIKQNQAFNQKGGSVFTFKLCSLEPCAEDAHSLLALAYPPPEQARYQRIPGNARFETSYEEQQKKSCRMCDR